MKYQLQLLIFILLCLAGRLDASPLYDYGLYLKSHAVPAPERSTLYLDDNQPFSVKNDLTISFQIYIRASLRIIVSIFSSSNTKSFSFQPTKFATFTSYISIFPVNVSNCT